MRLVLLGSPGVGKGTQAKLLEERLGIPAISTGEILRTVVQNGSPLGRKAKKHMSRGELVPDDVIVGIVEERLGQADCRRGFVLDGFPRTVAQAEAFEEMLRQRNESIRAAISLEVPREEILSRLSGRRTCRECGAMYHVTFNPPERPGHCDRCSGALYQREDDREDTVRARLEVYERETAPVKDYFRRRGLLRETDGTGATDVVLSRILREVGVRA